MQHQHQAAVIQFQAVDLIDARRQAQTPLEAPARNLQALHLMTAQGLRQAPLTGDPPNPIDPPSGCRFHTRCAFAEAMCGESKPLLTEISASGHQTACFMAIPGSGHSKAPSAGVQ